MKPLPRNQTAKFLLAFALLTGVTACSNPTNPNESIEGPASTAPSGHSESHNHGGDAGLEGSTEAPATHKRPSWSKSEEKKAREVAEKATRAFVDTSKNQKDWLASLSPYLEPDARSTYAYTDPKTLQYGKLKKVGTPKPNQKYLDFVDVPVQVAGGNLNVELHYSEDYKKLQVIRFTESSS